MEFVGKKVLHSRDGEGTITAFYDNSRRFNVRFADGTERPYQYPDDFDGSVLTTNDRELQEQIDMDLMLSKGQAISYSFNGRSLFGLSDSKSSDAPYADPKTVTSLKKGTSYGESASRIYQSFCENKAFNWNIENKGSFGQQKPLYAQNCTREGYSVWFLAYSSYNLSKNEKRGVTNNIEAGTNNITVELDIGSKDAPIENTGEVMVTFVKNRKGQYEFWGVLSTKEGDVNKTVEPYTIYNRFVSDTYVPGTVYMIQE